MNWAVSLFSLSGSPFSKLTHIYLYKNIFTFSLEAMKQLFFFAFLFRLFPLRDQYFRFVVVVVVFFFFARQENDEARRRGKYKIKLWQHWAAAGNVWLYVGWIFPSQYKSLGRWAPKKKEERYTGKKKRNKKILKKIEEKENFFSSSSLPFHIRYKSFFGLYKYMNTED